MEAHKQSKRAETAKKHLLPISAHPKEMIRGLIFGRLRASYIHNTENKVYLEKDIPSLCLFAEPRLEMGENKSNLSRCTFLYYQPTYQNTPGKTIDETDVPTHKISSPRYFNNPLTIAVSRAANLRTVPK